MAEEPAQGSTLQLPSMSSAVSYAPPLPKDSRAARTDREDKESLAWSCRQAEQGPEASASAAGHIAEPASTGQASLLSGTTQAWSKTQCTLQSCRAVHRQPPGCQARASLKFCHRPICSYITLLSHLPAWASALAAPCCISKIAVTPHSCMRHSRPSSAHGICCYVANNAA